MADTTKKSIEETTSFDNIGVQHGPHSSDSSTNQHLEEKNTRTELNARSALAIIGSGLAILSTIGWLNCFGVLIEYYAQHQLRDKTLFQITWTGCFATFMFFIAAAPAGILVDRLPMFAGAIIFLLSIFMISLCKEYYQFFLAQGVLLGIGQALLTCPALATVSKHFDKNRGLAVGITVSGSSLGGVIWPIMLEQLLYRHNLTFGWTVRIIGFTMTPLVLFACIVVQTPKSTAVEKDKVGAGTNEAPKPRKKTDLSILKNKIYWTYCLGIGIYYLGMFTPFFFITSYAVSLGISTSLAFYLVSIVNGASFFGRIIAGWGADKLGHFNMCAFSALASAIIAFCWTAADNTAGLVVFALAYGYFSGSILSLQMTCATKLASPETYGTAVGMTMFIVSLTGLFGSPISGELIKYGWLKLSMYTGSTLLAGSVLMVVARFQFSRSLTTRF